MDIYIIILCIIIYLLFVTGKTKNTEGFGYVEDFRKARDDRDEYKRERDIFRRERDICNTTLTARTIERDICNTTLSARTGERDSCNTTLTARTGERDSCNNDYNYNSSYLNDLILLQKKYSRIFTPINNGELISQSSEPIRISNNVDVSQGNLMNIGNLNATGQGNLMNIGNLNATGQGNLMDIGNLNATGEGTRLYR